MGDRSRLYARGLLKRIVTISPERSKWRFARLISIGIVKSSRMSSLSPWRNKTATSSPRKFVSWRCEKKSIQPLCDMQERLVCTYYPVEQCSEEQKQYCYKVEEVVVEEVCDMKFDTKYI